MNIARQGWGQWMGKKALWQGPDRQWCPITPGSSAPVNHPEWCFQNCSNVSITPCSNISTTPSNNAPITAQSDVTITAPYTINHPRLNQGSANQMAIINSNTNWTLSFPGIGPYVVSFPMTLTLFWSFGNWTLSFPGMGQHYQNYDPFQGLHTIKRSK